MWCGVRPYVQFSYACCSAPPLLQHPLLSLTLLLEPTLPPLPRPSLHLLACSSRHHRLAIEAIHPLSPPLGTRYKKSSSSPPSPHYSNEPLTNEGKKGKPLPIPSHPICGIRPRPRPRAHRHHQRSWQATVFRVPRIRRGRTDRVGQRQRDRMDFRRCISTE